MKLQELPELSDVLKGRGVGLASPDRHEQEAVIDPARKERLEFSRFEFSRAKLDAGSSEHPKSPVLASSDPKMASRPGLVGRIRASCRVLALLNDCDVKRQGANGIELIAQGTVAVPGGNVHHAYELSGRPAVGAPLERRVSRSPLRHPVARSVRELKPFDEGVTLILTCDG